MHPVGVKAVLREQAARDEKADLSNPAYRFTVWSENGTYFSYEGHAEFDPRDGPAARRVHAEE
jgi:hypothetical protein